MNERFRFEFEKLDVWHLAVDLADYVLRQLEDFPPNRHLRLINQMEAAVASIAQNIAEGKGRQHKKEFIQFLHIALGSLFEVLTLTEIFRRRNLFTQEQADIIRAKSNLLTRKLYGLISSLKK